jgi:hypothetical protein
MEELRYRGDEATDHATASLARLIKIGLALGLKVRAEAWARFPIDVGYGDARVGQPEWLTGDELLSFARIGPPRVLAIPRARFAERVHAYSSAWSGRRNTGSKSRVDRVLLIERGPPDGGDIRRALEQPSPPGRPTRFPRRSMRRPRSGRRSLRG